jgi:hypothetical protein
MDLNYLFHRQQVERTRAEAAASEEARITHEQLARCYEVQINQLTGADFSFPSAAAAGETKPARPR